MIDHYKLAIIFMNYLNQLFGGDWYCEDPNADIDSWVFTDGTRRQKPLPRDAFQPMTSHNITFRQLPDRKPMVQHQVIPEEEFTDEDGTLLALAPDFGMEET